MDILIDVFILEYSGTYIPLFDYNDAGTVYILKNLGIFIDENKGEAKYFTSVGTPVKYVPEGSNITHKQIPLANALNLNGNQIPLLNLIIKISEEG